MAGDARLERFKENLQQVDWLIIYLKVLDYKYARKVRVDLERVDMPEVLKEVLRDESD